MTVRVFLLDDHEVVRRGVRELLEVEDDLEVFAARLKPSGRGDEPPAR